MEEEKEIRTRISKGYQVVVPSELRKQYKVDVGDEVLWIATGKGVTAKFRKKPSISNIVSLGHSGAKESAVDLKKHIQKGEL